MSIETNLLKLFLMNVKEYECITLDYIIPFLHKLSDPLWKKKHIAAGEVLKIKAIYHITDFDCWHQLHEASSVEQGFMNQLPRHTTQITFVYMLDCMHHGRGTVAMRFLVLVEWQFSDT
jgi:hypothetical protein